ncbi:MAG TPA: hypothetical protein VNC50_19730 [Planctomycetia bacterium]|nr:hypothetical protein [Planctomycetia bacterium]
MQSSKLMAVVGAGGVMSFAGAVLLGAGVAMGLAAAIPQIPLGFWMALCGVALLVAGPTLVTIGGEKTAEKVEKELSAPKLIQNFPWAAAGVGIAATALLYALLRRPAVVPAPAPAKASPAPPPPEPERKSAPTFFDTLTSLAAGASASAAAMGLQALGVPKLDDLMSSIFGGDEKKESKEQETGRSEEYSRNDAPRRSEASQGKATAPNGRR